MKNHMSNSLKPGLTVIMPHYNHGEYVERAINSHLWQTRPPARIIIVDDKSSDTSVKVLKKLERDHSCIRLIERAINGGPNKAINTGLEFVETEFVCLSGADDFVSVEFSNIAISALESHPEAAFHFSDPSSYFQETECFLNIPLLLSEEATCFTAYDFEALFYHNHFSIPSNTAVYRTGKLLSAGGFWPNLHWNADWFTNLFLALDSGVCYTPGFRAHFQINENSYGHQGVKSASSQRELLIHIIEILESRFPDIYTRFRRAALVPEMRLRTLRFLLGSKSGRRFLTTRLAIRLCAYEAWAWMRPWTPKGIRVSLRRIAASFNQTNR